MTSTTESVLVLHWPCAMVWDLDRTLVGFGGPRFKTNSCVPFVTNLCRMRTPFMWTVADQARHYAIPFMPSLRGV